MSTMSLAGEAKAANDVIANDPAPTVPQPPDTQVKLIRGLLDPKSGVWQTTAVVREMTGADEEALAALDARSETTYGHYMTTLLTRTVESIGSIDVTEQVIDQLIIGDRDLLFLGTVRATYGKTKDFKVVCRNCQTSNDVVLDLVDDFPIRTIDRDLTSPAEVRLRNGSSLAVRMPDGEDTRIVGEQAKNLAEQNTLLISRCVVWGQNRPADPVQWAKDLNSADRRSIVNVLMDQPGPEMEEVKAPCVECGQEMTLILDWASLLLA